MVVAIDGPAGSGKSTIARLVAQKLGAVYLDTGALYRALTLKVLGNAISLNDTHKIIGVARGLKVDFKPGKVFLDSEDVSLKIREPRVDQNISAVARIPQVRKILVEFQRRIGNTSVCVAEGRDTTTVVFPDAVLKVYLDADFNTRVRRRKKDFDQKGISVDTDNLKSDLFRRDTADTERKVGALKQAEDAVYLDTTDMTIEQVVDRVVDLARQKTR